MNVFSQWKVVVTKDGTSGTTQEQAEQPREQAEQAENQDLDQLAKLFHTKNWPNNSFSWLFLTISFLGFRFATTVYALHVLLYGSRNIKKNKFKTAEIK